MSATVHHTPIRKGAQWHLHAWQLAWDGNSVWESVGTVNGDCIDFQFPQVADARKLRFKYRSNAPQQAAVWESEEFVRQIIHSSPAEVWTFEASPRILYENPNPSGVSFKAGDVLTFYAISKQQFRGGQLYAWNPYDPTAPEAYFPESARDDTTSLSTFSVTLSSWMTSGFHLKLMNRDSRRNEWWEADRANRVWRPADGATIWLKSGQCDLRRQQLVLAPVDVEMLLPAGAQPPTLTLWDVAEATPFTLASTGSVPFPGSPLFQVARYSAPIYPQAGYEIFADSGESDRIRRSFPANSADIQGCSRFVLGASAWRKQFPTVAQSVTLSVEPRAPSSFDAGLNVETYLGNSMLYQTVAAARGPDGSWSAPLTVPEETTTRVRLVPASGEEPKPYDWIDTGRYFTPPASQATYFTTEGVYGVALKGKTSFAEPPSRRAVMQAAFGSAIAGAGIFAPDELPHGATQVGPDVYFCLHDSHAVYAGLVLVDESVAGEAKRREIPMTLTPDLRYWWCAVPGTQARPGSRYHYVINDDTEVLDPASREVLDRGSFRVSRGCDPNDPTVSWSLVLDVPAVHAQAHASPWQTMGWQNLLIYEMHAQRFTDLLPDGLKPLDLVADELQATSRLGRPGYLRNLPVTALELMPVNEMNFSITWGYDMAFMFSVDSHYGGAAALARLVNAAHASGRAVLVDLVYNHTLGSPLMEIAPDVYRNGNYCGDRMNCGHPMVLELLRQAAIYMWRTFGLDGFRFDDTKTMITCCQGGWETLSALRSSIHAAASAEGRGWPYCVAENWATQAFDVADPTIGVMDGVWNIDEVFRIRDASYDLWSAQADHADSLRREMERPTEWNHPFYEVIRVGEDHDIVSTQDPASKRIAARPPFGEGLQLAKAFGTLTLLSNGVPMLFMGQEYGEHRPFSFEQQNAFALNPQELDAAGGSSANGNARVLEWFRRLMLLRDDPWCGLQGDENYQVVRTGHRTVAFRCGHSLFAVVTFGTADQRQDSSWLGLPEDGDYKEILNSSWTDFQVENELQRSNGGDDAHIHSGKILNLPFIGALVLQRQ